MKKYVLICCAVIFASLFLSCKKEVAYHSAEGMIWNTSYHITFKGSEALTDSIIPVLDEVSKSLSVFDKNSLVSKLNNSMGIEADQHLSTVYKASKKIHKLSHGNFDPTLGPLIDAWGFGKGHIPSSDTLAVDSILQFIGLDKTNIRDNKILKEDIRTNFNFSAIAKGYGCDKVGDMFRRNGVYDYMVEIGGEISLSGNSPSGNLWSIGIDAPVAGNKPGDQTVMILSLSDAGIATSGNYRNFREDNGVVTAHTISPASGRPILSEIISATVIAKDCMEADGLATACMAGNLQEAKALLKASGAEGLLILKDSVWQSPGFSGYVLSH